jgi:DNA-binding MarR family transcriptional regulator
MLILRAYPDSPVSINDLAQQLLIKHNSAVELVDRLEREGLIVREGSRSDRRKVELRLTGRGRQVLAKLAATHRSELQRIGPMLQRFFVELARVGGAADVPSLIGAVPRAARTSKPATTSRSR